VPVAPAAHRFAIQRSRNLENGVDIIADFSPRHQKGGLFRLPSINLDGKGLRSHRPKKHRRVSGAAKAETHSNSQSTIVRVISGNGGQACL
jgi:hypothetical protein